MCLTHPPISFFFTDTPTTEIYTLSLHDALPISALGARGLRPGDRVLIAAPNSPALVHVWLGTIWAGGIPAAVNPESTPAEIDYLVEDLQPRITLHQEELELLGATTTAAAGATAATVDPLDVAAIVYTSGTTSRPKGVMVRHAAYTETGQ